MSRLPTAWVLWIMNVHCVVGDCSVGAVTSPTLPPHGHYVHNAPIGEVAEAMAYD